MEDNSGINLEYWLSIPSQHQKAVYTLRIWSHLKLAVDENLIWIRGFTQKEIDSQSVLRIPMIERYFLKGSHLVAFGNSLPAMVEPSLLWSPIQRGLKIQLPKENFNFFGVKQTFKITIVPSQESKITDAALVDLTILEKYLETAPKVRLKNLEWTIIENNKALILGGPLLPIKGKDLYQMSCFLIPSGWKLEYEKFSKVFKQALGESEEYWYLINENSKISKLRKSDFNSLSKGSLVKTLRSL